MLVVVGGGCYGSYHARQLLKAIRSGRLPAQPVVVVDRDPRCAAAVELGGAVELATADWLTFLRGWLASRASAGDHVVPAPLTPHLLWEWLAGEVDADPVPPPAGWRLPYEQAGRTGERYLSAAGWTCPATCVEPAHCPILHAPRDWDLATTIEARARALGYRPAIFRCLHLANGVGAVRAGALLAAREAAVGAPAATRILVATSSRCHAAVAALQIRATR